MYVACACTRQRERGAAMGMREAGAYLRERRDACDLTQQNVGDELGVSGQIVSMWELGTSVPKGDSLMRYCDLVGADIREVQRLYLGKAPPAGANLAGVSTEDLIAETNRRIDANIRDANRETSELARSFLARLFGRGK